VVAHKDRLARFGLGGGAATSFELISFLVQLHFGKIMVLKRTNLSPEQELTNDLLSILHVFE